MTASNPALDPENSATVAASAGSGKTWLLVSRIVRLLLSGAEPGGILALTFTRKAAAEMRDRVAQQLRHLAYIDSAGLDASLQEIGLIPSEELRASARLQFERLAFQPIGLKAMTLHGFCQEVLTRFALEAQVPAGFSLVEDESEWRAMSLDRLWTRIREGRNPGLAEALRMLFDTGAREWDVLALLRGFIDNRSDWWAFTEGDGDPPVAAAARLAAQLEIDPSVDPCEATDAPAFTARLKMLAGALREVGGVGTLKAEGVFEALDASGAARAGKLAKILFTKDGPPRVIKQKKTITNPQWAHIFESFNSACATLNEVRERQLRLTTWRRNAAAFRLGQALLDEFRDALHREGSLGFAELEWRTCQLLGQDGGSTWVRYKLDQRLAHVLLDEFQDTNPTQWRMLRPLVEEFEDVPGGSRRTLFVVGDTKQSIYGFRRAAPELMREAQALVLGRLGGSGQPLNASRRSAPAIITFLNRVFTGDAGAQIEFQPHETLRTADWGAVELLPLVPAVEPAETQVPDGLRDSLTTPFREAAARASEDEGSLVARRLLELEGAGLLVADRGRSRRLRWGDVMILARQRTHLWAIEAALASAGIPFLGSTRGALLSTVLAQDLMALMRVLDAPHRDLDLAQVLRSPLFCADDGALARLAADARSGAQRRSWWASLLELGTQEPGESPLGRARRLLPAWLAAGRQLPAHDLLDRIASEGDVANRFEAALPHEPRVRANLGAFVQRILDTDSGRYPTLGRLNSELERLAGNEGEAPDEGSSAGGGERVRVLTVHAAKGLEAPLVFLVNAAPAETSRSGGWRIQWPANRAAPTHFVHVGRKEERDAVSTALVRSEHDRESREGLNLLYVALTRARQYLFVSAFQSGKAGSNGAGSWHARCWAALDDGPASDLPGAPEGARGLRTGDWPASTEAPSERPEAETDLPSDPRLGRPLISLPTDPSTRIDPAVDVDATRRGQGIHRLLQRLAEGASDLALLRADVELHLEEPVGEEEFGDWQAEASAVIHAPGLARFFAPGARAWNEVPVLIAGNAPGVIDRMVDDGETLWVLDYKTAKRPDAEVLRARYRSQLDHYGVAIRRVWPGRAVRCGLVATATREWIELAPD